MKFAFVMDPLEKVKAYKDTTYFLMLAAVQRGHEVFYLDQGDLFLENRDLYGTVTPVEVHADHQKPFTKHEPRIMAMGEMDRILIRTDPPFDRTYIYATLLMEYLPEKTKVVNRPSGLRNLNEKLAALYFPEFIPRTLVSSNHNDIRNFIEKVGSRVTIKPVDGHGGRGIFFVEKDNPNLDQLLALMTHGEHRWIVVQEYVRDAKLGDRRILLVNGEPIGGILRKAAEGKELNNLDAGGSAHPLTLTESDMAICRAVGPKLVEEGILFCGIDILGDKLIEVNVTSPTGLQELCRFAGRDYHLEIIEAIENA